MTGDNAVRPKLVVRAADDALDFYARTLDAEVLERVEQDGAVVFASFRVLGSVLTIKDEDGVDPASGTTGAPGVILEIVVVDPDAVVDRMVAAGADVVFPVADQEYGARGGRVRDPFGVQWLVQTRPRRPRRARSSVC